MTGIREFRPGKVTGLEPPAPDVAMTRAAGALAVATDHLVPTTTAFLEGQPSADQAGDVFAVLDQALDRLCLARAQVEIYVGNRRAAELVTLAATARRLAGPTPRADPLTAGPFAEHEGDARHR